MNHSFAIPLIIGFVLCSGSGCRHQRSNNHPSPASQGMNSRDLIDPIAQTEAESLGDMTAFGQYAARVGHQLKEERRRDNFPGRPQRNVLCLSGGGSFGAYSAGVLVGWSQRGDRPCFDVVTGISTGALLSPFAFLGAKYDAQMQEFFTSINEKDIFTKRLVRGVLGAESFADSAPLRRLISSVLTPELVADIAAAHNAGRRLYVGTTEVESKRFIIWNLGAMACRNAPGDIGLMTDVILGSASIPGLFPSAKIDVYVDGVRHTERHVDGGVSQSLFFHPPYVPPEYRTAQGKNLVDTNVFVIVAGKLYADAEVLRTRALTGAGSAVSSLLYTETRGDLQRLWTFSLLTGMNFHMNTIPQEFAAPLSSTEFDPKTMTALFEEGRRVALSGQLWRTTPPGTAVNEGESIQERSGRCLTFQPRGPQLPIAAPRGKTVPPRYPGAGSAPYFEAATNK